MGQERVSRETFSAGETIKNVAGDGLDTWATGKRRNMGLGGIKWVQLAEEGVVVRTRENRSG